jgi:HEAT repeat protein
MRILSWLLAGAIALPLFVFGSKAETCITFKKPGGSVPPGMREPSDPTPPPSEEPSDPEAPPPPTDPGPTTPPPSSGPITPKENGPTNKPTTPGGDGPQRGKQAADDTTWETWWELNRIEFFPRRWVQAVVTTEGPQPAGPQHVSAEVVENKLLPVLRKLVNDKQVFVREAALITMGRVAATEAQRAEARETLLKAIKDKNHLIARAAALGLFYVADETSIRPMYMVAKDDKAPEDVRAFLALTLTCLKSSMAGELLKDLASAEGTHFELSSAALMALGYNGVQDDPSVPEFLIAQSKSKSLRAELRAEALESFGRIGDFKLGHEVLRKALAEKDENPRRSGAIALGVLDYRTEAERQIALIRAPYEAVIGVPLTPEDEAKVKGFEALIPTQRQEMAKDVKEVVRALGEALSKDSDAFVNRMAAISLGRIAAQTGSPEAIKHLEAAFKKDQVGMREYALLSLAIAKAPGAFAAAEESLNGKNKPPTTRGAACVAFGLLGDPRADALLKAVIETDPHPYIRGYAAIGAGMVGTPSMAAPVQQMLRTTRSPISRAYGALGLALLGTAKGADDIVAILKSDEVRDAFVASHMVYALGLTKDRRASTFDTLIAKAQDDSDMYVQAATVAAIGYLSTGEFYPRRHLMARGFNYLMNFEVLTTYFYKL